MYRNSFIACILALACFTILIPSVGSAQSDKVKASMAALKAETAKLGPPRTDGADLYFGKTKVSSNELVDAVVKEHGGVATLFLIKGPSQNRGFVRVATNEQQEDGKSAVGTVVSVWSFEPAICSLLRGPPYYGDVTVFGKSYDAGYELILGEEGRPIGAYFVGQPNVLIPSVGSAQNDKVKSSMAALKAETAKLGAPRTSGGDLYFGDTKVSSNELVDAVVKDHGGVATLFVIKGSRGDNQWRFMRVATNLQTEDGKSAVGTAIEVRSLEPAICNLLRGHPYYGDETVFGKTYDAGYEDIIEAVSGRPIGAYYVGQPK